MLPPCAKTGSDAMPASAEAPASSVRRLSVDALMISSCRLQRLPGAINVSFRETRKAERLEIERSAPVGDPLRKLLPDRGAEREAMPAKSGRDVEPFVRVRPVDDRNHVRSKIDAP